MGTSNNDYSTKGMWEPIKYKFKYLPVHVSLLHTGKVLAFGGSGNNENNFKTPNPAEIFDPQTGEIKTINQKLDGDIFCAGHAFLPDGRLLVAGGTYRYDNSIFGIPMPPFSGLDQSYLFDPVKESWTRVEDMSNGRWYPSLISMGDGRVLAVAGLTKTVPWMFLSEIEVYSPSTGWQKLSGANRWLPLYPRLHLLPSGEIFYSGSYNTHYTFPFTIKGFPTSKLDVTNRKWNDIGHTNQSEREEGASLLLPLIPPDYHAKVLLIGGGTAQGEKATNEVEMIDLSDNKPLWKKVKPMKHARYYTYTVMLPDQKILVLGGRKGKDGHHMEINHDMHCGNGEIPHDPDSIMECEIYDYKTDKWTVVSDMNVDRVYHSSVLLLPDGRVMVSGSNPMRRCNELRIEIYQPHYLFKGPRPEIQNIPDRISYGKKFEIKTDDAEEIDIVALIRPSSTTHCIDINQRYVELIFDSTAGNITAEVTSNHNLAPPGYYMLFIIKKGIPSKSKFICLS